MSSTATTSHLDRVLGNRVLGNRVLGDRVPLAVAHGVDLLEALVRA